MTNGIASTITGHELSEIRSFIEQRSGMVFDESRERFFMGRLAQYMEQKNVGRGIDLLRLMKQSNVEYDELLERVLTQETSFFRYPEMFRALERKVLPEMYARKRWSKPPTLRIWSAGCATGEEPYSIAMSIVQTLEFTEAWQIQILATDISRKALQFGNAGRYPRRAMTTLTPAQIAEHFLVSGDEFVVKPRLRNMVGFAPMNLAQIMYVGRFDCIMCMNVLIYFSDELRAKLIRRFAKYLEPGGYLFLGHAESAAQAGVDLVPIVVGDALIYRKPLHTRALPAGERL